MDLSNRVTMLAGLVFEKAVTMHVRCANRRTATTGNSSIEIEA